MFSNIVNTSDNIPASTVRPTPPGTMTPGNRTTSPARQGSDRVAALIAARMAAARSSFARGAVAEHASFEELVQTGLRAARRFGLLEGAGRPRAPEGRGRVAEPLRVKAR